MSLKYEPTWEPLHISVTEPTPPTRRVRRGTHTVLLNPRTRGCGHGEQPNLRKILYKQRLRQRQRTLLHKGIILVLTKACV